MGHGPPPGPGTGNAATPKKRRKKSRITPARQNPLQQAESPSTKRTLVPAPFPLALFEKTAKAGNPIASVPAMPCRQGGRSSNYAKNLLMRHGAEQPQTCPNLAAPLFHTTGTPAARPPRQSKVFGRREEGGGNREGVPPLLQKGSLSPPPIFIQPHNFVSLMPAP